MPCSLSGFASLARGGAARFARRPADADLHGRCRAQVGAWRHRGDMARVQDVGARAGRARATRNTNVATGIGEARIALMMSRIAVSRPPGVSIFSTTRHAPFSTARFRPRVK